LIKKFVELFAIIMGAGIFPLIWILQGLGVLNLAGEILGATIAGETLILQFFFRKKEGEAPQ